MMNEYGVLKSLQYGVFDVADAHIRKKKEWLQQAHPREFAPDQWDVDIDLLFIVNPDCPECKRSLQIMRATNCEDGGHDVIGHCIWCLQDWQWHCDEQGWESGMQRFFHG